MSSVIRLGTLLLGLSPLFGTPAEGAARRPNVLFIAVDDLRPQLGCYGVASMQTPNIDRLAAEGIIFERAYCMVPTCGASRASLMTGIRPSRNRFVNYLAWAEKDAPGVTTLNTHFKKHGYITISNGKVFHHGADNDQGWSEPAWRPKSLRTYRVPENQALRAKRSQPSGRRRRGPAYEAADVADDAYADGKVLERSLNDLRRLAELDGPFFLAVGFYKPHLPFVAPKKYWDLYDRNQIRLPPTYHRPTDAPDLAIHQWGELRKYAEIPDKGPLANEMALTLIHGYYACVSYTDANIGGLLDELDHLGLTDNTIVVLWGDHGWNLGEHTLWCKHCCFETSMHAPLIVKAPGIDRGKKTRGLTEFIDIYPSLCELAGLSPPDHLQGRSFVPLLRDPDQQWKTAAIGRYRNGDTIRTDQFRFTEYTNAEGDFLARMLYDHHVDPGEDVNASEQQGSQQAVERLTKQLHEGMGKDQAYLNSTTMNNLFSDIPADLPEELNQSLHSADSIHVERIVSHGHASPAGYWYDQHQSEWVIVLEGAAQLRFEDETLEMKRGDFINIPAHRRHRVDWTTPDQPTIWLAIHYG